MKFELLNTDGHARRGRVHLNHGVVARHMLMIALSVAVARRKLAHECEFSSCDSQSGEEENSE